MKNSRVRIKVAESFFQREFNVSDALSAMKYPNDMIYRSWGAEKFENYMNRGLGVKVNGALHTGWLLVTLSYSDLFNVFTLDKDGNVLERAEDIYCDALQETIDYMIETNTK